MPDPLSEQLGSKSNSNQGKSSFLGTLGQNTLSSLVSGGVSSLFSELFADSQQHRMRENMRYQQQLNLDSLRKSPLMQVLGLKDAGLNPALLNGQVTGNTAQVSPGSPSGTLTPMQALFNSIDLQRANNEAALIEEQKNTQKSSQNALDKQAEFYHEQAEGKKIDNARARGADAAANEYISFITDNLTKSGLITLSPDTNDVKLPNVVKAGDHGFNLGHLRALREIYDDLKATSPEQWQSEKAVLGESRARALLNTAGYSTAHSDERVVNALAMMPLAQCYQLVMQAEKHASDIELNKKTGEMQMSQKDYNDAMKDFYSTLKSNSAGSTEAGVAGLTGNLDEGWQKGAAVLLLNLLMAAGPAAASSMFPKHTIPTGK